jgi:hypothetical protein
VRRPTLSLALAKTHPPSQLPRNVASGLWIDYLTPSIRAMVEGRTPRQFTHFSELIAPQLFKAQSCCSDMESKSNKQQPQPREEMIRELEQYSIEVLQTVLAILKAQQTNAEKGN